MAATNTPKTAVITGASAGIGKAAAKALLALGWRVIGVGRDPVRCAKAQDELKALGQFDMVRADMALLADTARAAHHIAALVPRIDALLNNAGGIRDGKYMSSEGHEATFAANHLSHFLLTKQLMPQLRAGRARIVTTSSDGHEYCAGMHWDDLNLAQNWSHGGAYCQAKLANVLFARELAKRGVADGITSNAIHPGTVTSNFATHGDASLQAHMASIIDRAISPEVAASTLVWLASAHEAAAITGRYYHQGEERDPAPAAMDDAAAKRLWDVSEGIVAGY